VSYGDLDIEERRKLLKGPAGIELLKILARSTAVLEWGDLSNDVAPSHGSMSFADTGEALLGITARHVYEAYVESAARNASITCQINNVRFNPVERLISVGADCDIATFAMRPSELEKIERITIPWPPVIPKVGQLVLFAGLPAAARKSPQPGHVDLGYYIRFADVDSVSDRDISSKKPPNDQLLDILGKGLPPSGYDLGGMSGGPLAVVIENDSILSWRLSGIIYECHPTFEIVKAARADVIRPDGTVDC
jgi:hypothetical protein